MRRACEDQSFNRARDEDRMTSRHRSEIPAEIAARVLFRSHRTCCVCRVSQKQVQIHHVDDDPSNGSEQNFAVLCFDCHGQTQIKGGFGRRLNAEQIVLYRDDWYRIVESGRRKNDLLRTQDLSAGPLEAKFEGKAVTPRFMKLSEKDDKNKYSFEAEYPQLFPDESADSSEINLTLAAYIVRELQKFRAGAIGASKFKEEDMMKRLPEGMCWIGSRLAMLLADSRLTSSVLISSLPNTGLGPCTQDIRRER